MRSNTTTESIQDGIENGNKSTVSAQLNKDLFVTSKIPNMISYESLSNATFNAPVEKQTFCTFSFEKNGLLQAIRQLSQSINLFYKVIIK